MKVAVIGGAFDPPHNGHILCITNVLNSGLVDEVWLVPSGDGRYDKSTVANSNARKKMLEVMMKHEFGEGAAVKLNLLQLNDPENQCFTSDLLQSLKSQYPDHEFFFVIGSDIIGSIKKWHEGAKLLRENKFIIVPRPANDSNKQPMPQTPDNFIALKPERVISAEISSSVIRELLSKESYVSGLIPNYLVNFIINHKLYA